MGYMHKNMFTDIKNKTTSRIFENLLRGTPVLWLNVQILSLSWPLSGQPDSHGLLYVYVHIDPSYVNALFTSDLWLNANHELLKESVLRNMNTPSHISTVQMRWKFFQSMFETWSLLRVELKTCWLGNLCFILWLAMKTSYFLALKVEWQEILFKLWHTKQEVLAVELYSTSWPSYNIILLCCTKGNASGHGDAQKPACKTRDRHTTFPIRCWKAVLQGLTLQLNASSILAGHVLQERAFLVYKRNWIQTLEFEDFFYWLGLHHLFQTAFVDQNNG